MTENVLNGMRYVGQSTKDSMGHEWYLGSGDRILHAIRKHGNQHFKKTIIEDGISDREILNEREKHWIREMDTRSPKGYNLKDGGTNWVAPSPETMAARVASQKLRRGPLNPKYGKKMPPQQYAKLRVYWDSQKGKPKAAGFMAGVAATRQEPVVQLTLEGEYVATFPSHIAAAKSIGRKGHSVSTCVHGGSPHCAGYRFMSLDEYIATKGAGATIEPLAVKRWGDKFIPYRSDTDNPVVQLAPSGAYIATFVSMTEAGRQLNISFPSIHGALNGHRELTCGYSFMFEADYDLIRSAGATVGPFHTGYVKRSSSLLAETI